MFHALLDPGAHDGVGVAFTNRHGGVSYAAIRTGLDLRALVSVHQVHGTDVLDVDGAYLAGWNPDSTPVVADALVTSEPGVGLAVRVADCLPVLLADPAAGVVGAAHAGRVGLAAGVLQETIRLMRAKGARMLTAWVGPSVCAACYEVPATMRDEVAALIPETAAVSSTGTPALDLAAGCRAVLDREGVTVVDLGVCTRESAELHSHRRDGERAGRQAGVVWRVGPGDGELPG